MTSDPLAGRTHGRSENVKCDPQAAVSEIIGAILMISLVVAAVAIVAVVLMSQSTPEQVPNINFMTGTNSDGTKLYLYHNGGDTLRRGQFAVVTDTDPAPRTDYEISDGSDEWSLGTNLILTVASPPSRVSVVYSGGKTGSTVLKSGSSSIAVPKVTIRPDTTPAPVQSSSEYIDASDPQNVVVYILSNTSLIADALNQSPSTVGPTIASAVGTNAINFYKGDKVSLTTDGSHTYYFTFNVTKPGSSISIDGYTPNPKPLLVGDQITIFLWASSKNFKTFGLGDQLWEVSADGVDVSLSHFTTPDAQSPQTNTKVNHAWITGYQDLGSTLRIATSGAGQTSLVVNGTVRINGDDSSSVIISNIRPVGVGLFVLEADNNAQIVYFVGNAQSVTRDGAPVV
ncbi:MAG: type IV pilin [Methanomicrobiales archaeon]|nr:type IV pilin [Methanomicrobiales archaeon]